jgi:hypothetical protein
MSEKHAFVHASRSFAPTKMDLCARYEGTDPNTNEVYLCGQPRSAACHEQGEACEWPPSHEAGVPEREASPSAPDTFERALAALLNSRSMENASNTPDFILAELLSSVLTAWNVAVQQRETWYGRDARPNAKDAEIAVLKRQLGDESPDVTLLRERDALRADLDAIHGRPFSKRVYEAMLSRIELAEAERDAFRAVIERYANENSALTAEHIRLNADLLAMTQERDALRRGVYGLGLQPIALRQLADALDMDALKGKE